MTEPKKVTEESMLENGWEKAAHKVVFPRTITLSGEGKEPEEGSTNYVRG